MPESLIAARHAHAAGKFLGTRLKTTAEGVQYLARGTRFWFTQLVTIAVEFKNGIQEGRRG